LKQKGIYTNHARALARVLIRCGCSQRKVGEVVQLVGKALGITVLGRMSAHTVRRVVLEGGIASDLQMGFELSEAKAFTVSSDATSNRHIDYMSRFAALRVPTYKRPLLDISPPSSHSSSSSRLPSNRFLGVESSLDHTSERQVVSWKSKLDHVTTVLNTSPMAKRLGISTTIEDCFVKLRGVGGDHAADQLKTVRLLQEAKTEATYLVLARDHLGAGDSAALSPALMRLIEASMTDAVDASGGVTAWASLSPELQVSSYSKSLRQQTAALGKDLFGALPDTERRPLQLFLRLGCAMHKDLNSFKGGNTAMMAEWGIRGLTPPILLANKDNAATLRDVDTEALAALLPAEMPLDGLSAAELRALQTSARGGVKLVSLAGAIFNHKDDKKGQQDSYAFYFTEVVGQKLRFPDTSNTRYHTYGGGAAELITNLTHYIRFLEVVRNKKERPRFSHIEENVYAGLQDVRTLTELAAMTLYDQAITHPYLRMARVLQNGLKLGPMHDRLKAHIRTLASDPDLLLGPDASYERGAMGGLKWQRPEAVQAVLDMQHQLPHLRWILVAFLTGSLQTWDQFTIEFAKGGAIDGASETELDDSWIFATNDHNEAALGGMRIWACANPSGTQEYFNAQKKHDRNDTAAFMETYFEEEDFANTRAKGHCKDVIGASSAPSDAV
ncbi:hypothetical protein K466DRAFT_499535, partial [Polyporus arcularius HHB13444]